MEGYEISLDRSCFWDVVIVKCLDCGAEGKAMAKYFSLGTPAETVLAESKDQTREARQRLRHLEGCPRVLERVAEPV